MVNVRRILVTIRRATDGHNTEIVKGVNLCTSFIFTSGSRREGSQKGRALLFERPPTQKNNSESMRTHSLQMPTVPDPTCGKAGIKDPARKHKHCAMLSELG
jgi:hypothetical protein